MKIIYKYPLELADTQKVGMPKGAQILSAQLQNNVICLWALVDPSEITELRTIAIIGTGHKDSFLGLEFIDTVQEGNWVWHIFETTI